MTVIHDKLYSKWVDMETGAVIAEPPTQRYRYRVGAKPIVVEQTRFAPGTLLGVGTVAADYLPVHVCEFTPSEGFSPMLSIGRIHARLTSGQVRAEPIIDETD
jgi:hypothetical protein